MRSTAWLAIFAVLAIAAALLLHGLGDAPLRPYDEGLYARLTHNARLQGVWMHAVEADGSFSTDFSKPPLSLWFTGASFRAFGVSMTALRLPFALGMLGVIGVCIAWGTRTRGPAFGAVWGATLTATAATLRWGRSACIEPLFFAFVLLSLWAHAEAIAARGRRADRWALIAGAGLALAFFTKQLAVGIAVAPMLAVEIVLAAEARAGRARRLVIVLGMPAVLGGAWLVGVLRQVGSVAIDTFFVGSVGQRLAGFRSGHNARALNEIAGLLDEVMHPFPWALGIAGLLVAVWIRRGAPDPAQPPARLRATLPSIVALLVTATVLYDNVARTLLPWYAFAFVPPLAAGLAELLVSVAHAPSAPTGDAPRRTSAVVAATLGVLALCLALIDSARAWASQLDVALLLAALVAAWWWRPPSPARASRWLAAGLALLFVGRLRAPELHADPGGLETLMADLHTRRVSRVDVDVDTGAAARIQYAAYFGPGARSVRVPPWRRAPPHAEAWVTATIPPAQLRSPHGVELVRGAGAVAWVGDLSRPAWSSATTRALLDAGPIDFEAEHVPSRAPHSLQDDAEASGGRVRARAPFGGERLREVVLSDGPGWTLPPGNYIAEFHVQARCTAPDAKVGWIAVFVDDDREAIKSTIACDHHERAIPLSFRLIRDSRVDLRVVHTRGGLSHDRTTVTRTSN